MGLVSYPDSGWDGPATNNTLGSTNICSTPWSSGQYIKQGMPLFWRDGPMETIGEIGHIRTGDVTGEYHGSDENNTANWYWQTINLMSYDYGAYLLDRMTIRDTNSWIAGSQTLNPTYGLVNLNTTNTNVLLALYNGMGIGPTNSSGQYQQTLSAGDSNVQALVSAIISQPNGPYSAFQSLFSSNNTQEADDPVASAFVEVATPNPSGNAAADEATINEIQRQDPIRKILDMITFRQNLFTVRDSGAAIRTGWRNDLF